MPNANLWFERAILYRDRGQRAKCLHALKIGRQCAIATGDGVLASAFVTAITLMAA